MESIILNFKVKDVSAFKLKNEKIIEASYLQRSSFEKRKYHMKNRDFQNI